MSSPDDPQPPRVRSRAARWLFDAEGPDSPDNAKRNAVFVTAAAGIYVFVIIGSLPPRDLLGYVQAIVAVLLILAASNAWRAYRKARGSAATQDPEPRDE